MLSTSLALLAQEFPPAERASAFAVWGATTTFALAIGPLAGGVLTSAFGWRAVFFVNVPIGIVLLILTVTRMVNVPGPPSKIDVPGFVVFSLALFALVFAIIRGNDAGMVSAQQRWLRSPPASCCSSASCSCRLAAGQRCWKARAVPKARVRRRSVRSVRADGIDRRADLLYHHLVSNDPRLHADRGRSPGIRDLRHVACVCPAGRASAEGTALSLSARARSCCSLRSAI